MQSSLSSNGREFRVQSELVSHEGCTRTTWHSRFQGAFAQGAAEAGGCANSTGDLSDALAALLTSTAFDATLVMNHNYHLDARSLAALAETQIPYVGLLGPAARRDDLLREIGGSFAAQLRSRLRAPVGLPLGGEGAEAIALAIVAQVQNQLSRSAYGD